MIYILFFISNTFISKTRLKFIKNQAKAKQHPEAQLFILREPLAFFVLVIIQREWGHILKNVRKTSVTALIKLYDKL